MEGETEEEIERRTYALDIHQQALCLPEDSLVFLRAKDISSENEGVERILRNCRWVGCANPSSSGCSQRILDLLRYRQGTILPSAWRSSRTSSPILVTVNNNEPSENIHWVPGIVHASLSQFHTVLKKMRPRASSPHKIKWDLEVFPNCLSGLKQPPKVVITNHNTPSNLQQCVSTISYHALFPILFYSCSPIPIGCPPLASCPDPHLHSFHPWFTWNILVGVGGD